MLITIHRNNRDTNNTSDIMGIIKRWDGFMLISSLASNAISDWFISLNVHLFSQL